MNADSASGAPHPQPPAGLQRPGIPGAGNLLDPAVRADLREQLHPAVHGAVQQLRGQQPAAEGTPAEQEKAPEEPLTPPAPTQHRSGPYPHGDVDLSYISANVPSEPVRPQRRRTSRRFFFLGDQEPAQSESRSTPVPPSAPPAGPKPG